MSGSQNFDLPYREGRVHLALRSNSNNSVIILLPGQTLPSEMFFDLPIWPDGSCITDRILEADCDVAHLNPVGYGHSKTVLYELYTRETMAEQVCLAVDLLRFNYKNILLHGFCSTSHVPMIAATKRNVQGIIAQSPLSFRVGPQYYQEYMTKRDSSNPLLHNSLENLKENRLKKKSDVLLGYSNKVDNWEELFITHLKTFKKFEKEGEWSGINDMVWDLWLYVSQYASQGWNINNISCPISVVVGEKDYECSTENFERFVFAVKPKLISKNVAPNGTHFGMWDKNYQQWAQTFTKSIKDLLARN